jgi:hypothetical protein
VLLNWEILFLKGTFMSRFVFILAVALISSSAFSKSLKPKDKVPLMPSRYASLASLPDIDSETPDIRERRDSRNSEYHYRWGIELGALGRSDSYENDMAGFQLYWGGRVSFDFSFIDWLVLRPSFSYFVRQYSLLGYSGYEHLLIPGLSALFRVGDWDGVEFEIGIVNEWQKATGRDPLSWFYNPQPTPSWAYKLGPTASFNFKVGKEFWITTNGQVTFSTNENGKAYPQFSIGISQGF